MTVFTAEISLNSRREGEIIDITPECEKELQKSGMSRGVLFVFVPGSTAAITTTEYEPGMKKDIPHALERIAPADIDYEHERTWHDGNGRSHVKAALLKPDLAVPFQDNRLMLGTWQQIVFVELDVRPRSRIVIIQIMGE